VSREGEKKGLVQKSDFVERLRVIKSDLKMVKNA
jgi:hypothetical protein